MYFSCYDTWLGLIAVLMSFQGGAATTGKVTVIDTGSTNRPGLQVTTDQNGNARVQSRGLEAHAIQLDRQLSKHLLQTLQSVGPLSSLPAAHCMKSVSFGSRLFIEYNGQRSPDLNCPVQNDPKVSDLQKQASDILAAAHVVSRPKKF